MKSYNSKDIGNIGEMAICRYLTDLNFEVVCTNYTIRGGEVDIIACNDTYILFVEVKTRSLNYISSGWDAITTNKKRCILKTASNFCSKYQVRLQPRFDVALVTLNSNLSIASVEYCSNAFDTTGTGIYIPIL